MAFLRDRAAKYGNSRASVMMLSDFEVALALAVVCASATSAGLCDSALCKQPVYCLSRLEDWATEKRSTIDVPDSASIRTKGSEMKDRRNFSVCG